jgi:hypothetical protein
VQPSGTFATTPFVTQPQVRVRDANGNIATNYTGNITLSVNSGTGALSGTTTVAAANGIASFSGLSYSASEAGIVLRATDGSLNVLSNAFTVSALPPGNCLINDANFTTDLGGCKDTTTDLVWSSANTASRYINSVIWDASTGGAGVQEVSDYGRTNDFDESAVSICSINDTNASSYCHTLNEGGYSDWRTPTFTELQALYSKTPASYLRSITNNLYVSSTCGTGQFLLVFNLQTGATSSYDMTAVYTLGAVCVRNSAAKALPAKLTITQGLDTFGKAVPVALPYWVRIQDASGNNTNVQGVTITVSSNLEAVSGTVTAVTDKSGLAVFNNFSLSTPGTHVLTFSASGYASATKTVAVSNFEHPCTSESVNYQTLEGGCKDMGTHLVWSRISSTSMTWYDAVWDSTIAGNPAPDAGDGVRTDDYDSGNAPGPYPDLSSYGNYCHDLVEGGYSDWRMPTKSQASMVRSVANLPFPEYYANSGTAIWTSGTNGSTTTKAYMYPIATGFSSDDFKTISYRVMCVRTGT